MPEPRDPFVGPRPFDRKDAALFFGRERESSDLLSLIIAHPAILLYSQSGAGKTSLLQAKVVPLLEEERESQERGPQPQKRGSQVLGIARVGGRVPEGVDPTGIRNIYSFHTWMTLREDRADPAEASRQSLSELLKSIPWELKSGRTPARRVIIFDQFEEIFTSAPARWKERESFFDELGALLEDDPRLRVVFAMREEYIAGLDPYLGLLPERLRTRFRLEQLREEAALQAVKGPLQDTKRTFAPGAAEKLVRNLLQVPVKEALGVSRVTGEFVEPVHLQVVCRNLWRSLPSDVTEIAEAYVEDYGDVDEALSGYYDDCIQTVSEETALQEGILRRWFGKKLITSEGTRGLVYMGVETTGDLPNKAVERFEDLHLLRAELRGGARWYELAHDRLIEPVQRSNQKWSAERDRVAQVLEDRAEQWVRKGKPEGALLSRDELRRADEWLKSPAAEDMGVSETILDLVKASRDRHGRVQTTRVLAILASGLLVALILMIYNWRAQRAADDAKYSERGDVAKYLAKHGERFDALVFGIRAVEPRFSKGEEVPKQALDGLRSAVGALGNYIWLHQHEPIQDAILSESGRLVVTKSKDTLSMWDARSGAPRGQSIKFEPGTFVNLHLSSDDKIIWINQFMSAGQRQIYAWSTAKGTAVAQLEPYFKNADAMGFSSDGSRVWVFHNGQVEIVEVATGRLLLRLPLKNGVYDLKISPDGLLLASLETLRKHSFSHIWSTQTGKLLFTLRFTTGKGVVFPTLLAFSGDGNKLLAGSVHALGFPGRAEQFLAVWNRNNGKLIDLSKSVAESIVAADFSEGGDRLVTVVKSNETTYLGLIFDSQTGREIGRNRLQVPDTTKIDNVRGLFVIFSNQKTTSKQAWNLLSGKVTDLTFPGRIQKLSVAVRARRFLAIEADGAAAITGSLEEQTPDMATLSAAALLDRACHKLAHVPEYEQVKRECSGRIR